MIKIFKIIGLFFFLNGCLIQGQAADNHTIFQEGIQLYQKADSIYLQNIDPAKFVYEKAANRFKFLVEKREIENGWLYYNLGNCYFRMGETGRAIYNYRMAEKYLPGNRDLINNLNYAKTFVLDTTDKNTKSVWRGFLQFVQSLPLWCKTLIFIVFYGSFWVINAFPLKKRVRPVYRWMSFGALLPVTFILFLSVIYHPKRGIILNDNVMAKKGNSLVYEDAFYSGLHQGTEFRIKEKRGEWIKIELPDGKTGWIETGNAGIIDY